MFEKSLDQMRRRCYEGFSNVTFRPDHDCYVVAVVKTAMTHVDHKKNDVQLEEYVSGGVGFYCKEEDTFYLSDDCDPKAEPYWSDKHISTLDGENDSYASLSSIIKWMEIDELSAIAGGMSCLTSNH